MQLLNKQFRTNNPLVCRLVISKMGIRWGETQK